jgi:AcrR family transcriptional regulator
MRAETTERLIAVARRAFAKLGFANVSLDALSTEASVTRGALHHHFGNKAGLFEAVLRRVDREIDEALDAVWSAEPDRWRAFCACLQAYLDEALDPSRRRILFQDAPAVLGGRAFDILLEGGLHYLVQDLTDLVSEGRIRAVDPEPAAQYLNGAILNLAFWAAEAPEGENRLPRAHATLAAMLDGLKEG